MDHMPNYIRQGDRLTSNGFVLTGAPDMSYEDRAVARKGDRVSCPIHDISPNLIIEGDETMTNGGAPIARHGHRVTCGCRLISSLV
jgi:uncharacterized Zn-binding protein involved in type VI secretion